MWKAISNIYEYKSNDVKCEMFMDYPITYRVKQGISGQIATYTSRI